MWTLQSRSNDIRLSINETENHLSMNCYFQSKPVFTADLGVLTESENGLPGALIDSIYSHGNEVYSLPVGKEKEYTNVWDELLLHFSRLSIRFRVNRDGVAFRYEFNQPSPFTIFGETTQFRLAGGFNEIYGQELFPTYERPYLRRAWDTVAGQALGMPVLITEGTTWLLFSEADLLTHADCCSSYFMPGQDRSLKLMYAREEEGKPLSAEGNFISPWRIVTISGSLQELVKSHLNYDLCQPSAITDQSWIRPARALWAWWEKENGAQLYTESKEYVDAAASFGFEAVTLDCGWDANWVPALCDYAHRHGVQIWLWTDRHRVDREDTMNALLPLWASWGVDGLKIDFFENDSAETMKVYSRLLKRAAELHLMINFHGSTKPMGDGRTWPHFMTAEGIMGLEHYKWSNMPNAVHNCTVPFTRNVSGPMDYTPVGFSNANRNTTHTHQLALAAVFESGVTHYSLSLKHLVSWKGTRFLQKTRASYDHMALLDGYPGKYTVMMRSSGDEYVIGAITVAKRELHVSMDFLPEGTFAAEIYEDSEHDNMVTVRKATVSGKDTLLLPLLENGGACIHLIKEGSTTAMTVKPSGFYGRIEQISLPDSFSLTGGSELMRYPDGETGVLLYGTATMPIDVHTDGWKTLRLTYTCVEDCTVCVSCESFRTTFTLPGGKSHYDRTYEDVPIRLNASSQEIHITHVQGDTPTVCKAELSADQPLRWHEYSVEQAVMTGQAQQVCIGHNTPCIAGLGYTSYLAFEQVEAEHSGRYILRIQYAGGESRDLTIRINDNQTIKTYLHSTSGWGYPTWENTEYKEYRVTLSRGKNTVVLSNPGGPVSHIYGISICEDYEEIQNP